VPTLDLGKSLTFKVDSGDSNDDLTSVTWTMGPKVTQATKTTFGAVKSGYEDVVFDLTIRGNGPYPIQGDPTKQSYLTWDGVSGSIDQTLAQEAALVEDGEFRQAGSDLSLLSGLAADRYASGYVAWEVPTAKGAVSLVSRQDTGDDTPDVVINYDGLTAKQIYGWSPGEGRCRNHRTAGRSRLR
jgi:hypothetical protein